MANFRIPYEFVAGTKAKAQEVNSNFSAIKEELDKKLDVAKDGYIVINDAVAENHPITKSQFDNSKIEINNTINQKIENKEIKQTFVIESGYEDENSNPDLLNIEDNTKVVFKIDDGTNFKSLKGVENGINFERVNIDDINVGVLSDGTYNLFVGKEGSCIPLANTIYRQRTEPIGIAENFWKQPVLTSGGTLGADKFAVNSSLGSGVYTLFNGNLTNTEQYIQFSAINQNIIIYNPIPLKITHFDWLVFRNQMQYFFNKCSVYGSDDNSNWEILGTFGNSLSWDLSNNTKAYRYHKVNIDQLASSYTDIRYCTITATQVVEDSLINAVWLDTSSKPYISKKYNGTNWEVFDYVPLPQSITVENGLVTEVNKIGNYNDNGWDRYTSLPDKNRTTILTKDIKFVAPLNGWISNGLNLVKPLFTGESFVPNTNDYVFYAMKGE